MYTDAFKKAGHDILWVTNAEDAALKAREFFADVVIADYGIQGHKISGLDVIPHIRKNLPNAQIIMLSNYGKSQMEEDCLTAGANHYLLKIDTPPKKLVEYIDHLV